MYKFLYLNAQCILYLQIWIRNYAFVRCGESIKSFTQVRFLMLRFLASKVKGKKVKQYVSEPFLFQELPHLLRHSRVKLCLRIVVFALSSFPVIQTSQVLDYLRNKRKIWDSVYVCYSSVKYKVFYHITLIY